MSYPLESSMVPKIPVSLITTLYNEEKTLTNFFDSILAMTVLPQEIVIVDGGSKDNTISILNNFKQMHQNEIKIKIIIDHTCTIYHSPAPIAKGRNVAIRHSSNKIIAVTDAGCTVDSRWLEEITKPFYKNPETQFVAGWYEPFAKTYFEECQALATFQSLKTVKQKKFLPSSRSVAFTKSIWEEVGGYPEIALCGEDTLFDINIKKKTKEIVFADRAVVYWRLRPNIRVFAKLVHRYGFGDGFSHILIQNLFKNSVKLLIILILIFLCITHSIMWFTLLFIYIWFLPFNGGLREAFRTKNILKYPAVSLLKIVANTAYLIGYLQGMFTKNHPKFEKINDH